MKLCQLIVLHFVHGSGISKVVDAAGNPLPVYHGTRRPDCVGTRFRKSRATAGPMAYFTDDPEIASNYASDKADTSIGDEYETYASWFKVKLGRTEVGIDQAWYFLPQAEKQRIASLAPRVLHDDEGNIILGGPEITGGIGGIEQAIREHRGNVLAALVDRWLTGGVLFNDEEEFLKVLKLAGMTTPVRFDHPNATYPAVYQVFLSIQTPLTLTTIPKSVLNALQKAANRQPHKPDNLGYHWDKDQTDAREWFRALLNDIEETGGKLSWTVIPNWVTKVLKDFGYDGIHDVGGKFSIKTHTVWIPFDEHQVKSAISNTNFDPNKKNIHA